MKLNIVKSLSVLVAMNFLSLEMSQASTVYRIACQLAPGFNITTPNRLPRIIVFEQRYTDPLKTGERLLQVVERPSAIIRVEHLDVPVRMYVSNDTTQTVVNRTEAERHRLIDSIIQSENSQQVYEQGRPGGYIDGLGNFRRNVFEFREERLRGQVRGRNDGYRASIGVLRPGEYGHVPVTIPDNSVGGFTSLSYDCTPAYAADATPPSVPPADDGQSSEEVAN